MADSQTRGDVFRTALEEERDGEPAAAVGLALNDMGPGMAVGGILGPLRKRGWVDTGAVPDWTTASVRAGV